MKPAGSYACCIIHIVLFSFLALLTLFILMTEATCSSQASVNCQRTIQNDIIDDKPHPPLQEFQLYSRWSVSTRLHGDISHFTVIFTLY